MRFNLKVPAVILALSAMPLVPSVALAQHYVKNNLVTDLPTVSCTANDGQMVSETATIQDPNLVNPWGLTRSPETFATPAIGTTPAVKQKNGSPWWVSDNNPGPNNPLSLSTLYDASGDVQKLVVTIPPAEGLTTSAPDGIVWSGNGNFGAASFIFSTEDGTIAAFTGSTPAILEKDNPLAQHNAGPVYKGITIADVDHQDGDDGLPVGRYLYVTNFRENRIEVYNTSFQRVFVGDHDRDDHRGDRDREGFFDDDRIPRGFAPFNIQSVGKNLVVTYAMQNAQKHDDVAGPGNGFVDVYTPSGKLLVRLEHGDWLNSPWGVALAPRDFGEFSNALLVGQFGSGNIAAYDPFTGRFLGLVKNPDDTTLAVNGLWGLALGNDGTAGQANTLYFTAGLCDETHGLFGTLTPVASEQDGDEE